MDNYILSLLATFVGMKLSQMNELEISKIKDKELLNTMNGINKVMEARSYLLFFIKLRDVFPPLVEYEYIGIYIYNNISKTLVANL